MSSKRSIFEETDIVKKMNDRTDVVEALLNGTFSITGISNKSSSNRTETSMAEYIPKEQMESRDSYANRLRRTYVTPYLANAIDSATGQVFKTPPHIDGIENIPERLRDIISYDIDMQGSDFVELAMDAEKKSMAYGMCITVGYYYNPTESDNLAVQMNAGARPYAVNISPRDLLGYTVGDDGKIKMLRFLEDALIDDEEFGSSTVKRVRRITPTEYFVYETDENKVDQIVEQGSIVQRDPYTGVRITDRVPCQVLYGRKEGVLQARSVFEDLAWINVHHTQVNSDLTWSSHFSLIPFLVSYLADEVDPDEFDLKVISSQINVALPKDSKIEWVETSGKPQELGFAHLEKIEDKIQISTMSSNVGVTGSKETATGRAIDANTTSAKLRSHSEALESWIPRVIEMLASFMPNETLGEFSVTANKEFDVLINADEIKLIQEDMVNGAIDRKTYFAEMKRRGIYQETVSIEEIDKGKAEDGGDANGKTDGATEPEEESQADQSEE